MSATVPSSKIPAQRRFRGSQHEARSLPQRHIGPDRAVSRLPVSGRAGSLMTPVTARKPPVRRPGPRPHRGGWRGDGRRHCSLDSSRRQDSSRSAERPPSRAAIPSTAKKAEAQQVMAQIAAMDAQLEMRIQRYDQATYKLAQIQKQLKTSTQELGVCAHEPRARAEDAPAARRGAVHGAAGRLHRLGHPRRDEPRRPDDAPRHRQAGLAPGRADGRAVRDAVPRHGRAPPAVLAKARVAAAAEVARQAAERGTVERAARRASELPRAREGRRSAS